jgi:hypothetical protein
MTRNKSKGIYHTEGVSNEWYFSGTSYFVKPDLAIAGILLPSSGKNASVRVNTIF